MKLKRRPAPPERPKTDIEWQLDARDAAAEAAQRAAKAEAMAAYRALVFKAADGPLTEAELAQLDAAAAAVGANRSHVARDVEAVKSMRSYQAQGGDLPAAHEAYTKACRDLDAHDAGRKALEVARCDAGIRINQLTNIAEAIGQLRRQHPDLFGD